MHTSIKKHRCKLCPRKFTNGRALGGHMRSHMMNLSIPRPTSEETVSASSSSSSSYEDIEEDGDNDDGEMGVLSTRKCIKLDDLEDRESETESTRTNPTRRRSRRVGRPLLGASQGLNLKGFGYGSDLNDVEQVSSISEVTSEEDVAFCLMMLSRDTWSYHERESGDITINCDDGGVIGMNRFKCETCNKVFRSYQALGGHRSSHKKTRVAACARPHTLYEVNSNDNNNDTNDNNNVNVNSNNYEEVKVNQQQKKVHECPICFRVFKSGQALGGHKRSHGVRIMENNNHQPLDYDDNDDHQICKEMEKRENIGIDLNLPAPVEDEEVSQIAVSAVS